MGAVKKSKKKDVSSDSEEPVKKISGPKPKKQKGNFASDSDEDIKRKKSRKAEPGLDIDKGNNMKMAKKDPTGGRKPERGPPASGSTYKCSEIDLERYVWDAGFGYYYDGEDYARTLAYLLRR